MLVKESVSKRANDWVGKRVREWARAQNASLFIKDERCYILPFALLLNIVLFFFYLIQTSYFGQK